MVDNLKGNYRGHHYDEYSSSISLSDRIVNETRENELIRGLAHYIHQRFEPSVEFNSNHRHTAKANAILEGSDNAKDVANSLNNKHPKAVISDAVSKGYIENFKLDEPWHPVIFRDPKRPTTYPFQHATSIWYRGEDNHIWFKEEVCDKMAEAKGRDRYYNHKSVFNSGKLHPGSTHVKDQHLKEDQKFDGISTLSTYWTTDTGGAEGTASSYTQFGGVLEAQIPSRWVNIVLDGYEEIDSLKKVKSEFKSPEHFRKEFLKNFRETKVTRQVLPLEYIKGVWPNWKFDEPYFLTLEEFHKLIYQKYPHKIPRNPKQIDSEIKTNNKEERRILKKELNLIEDLQEKIIEAKQKKELYHIFHLYEQNSIAIIDEKRDLKRGLAGIERRNERLNEISQELQTYFSTKPNFKRIKKPKTLIESLIEEKHAKKAHENPNLGITTICSEVKSELEEVKAEMIKREKQGNETILSSKMKKYMISEISRVPKIQVSKAEIIKALEPKLDFNPKEEGLI